MRFIKRLLLFVTVGTVSIVLTGCYGSPGMYRDDPRFPPGTTLGDSGPVSDIETAPVEPSS